MARTPLTYSMAQLEELSGFDRRTITYYVQEGLVPSVGRRGPKTTYPKEILDRLLFIRKVRELQDAGRLRAVTLSEIREALGRFPAEQEPSGRTADKLIRALFPEPDFDQTRSIVPPGDSASVREDTSVDMSFGFAKPTEEAPPSRRRSRLGAQLGAFARGLGPKGARSRSSSILRMSRGASAPTSIPPGSPPVSAEASPEQALIHEELRELLCQIEERATANANSSEQTTRERLTRVPITESILLSVYDISEEDAELVESLAELLRRIAGLEVR